MKGSVPRSTSQLGPWCDREPVLDTNVGRDQQLDRVIPGLVAAR
jgi:hypothetical protein